VAGLDGFTSADFSKDLGIFNNDYYEPLSLGLFLKDELLPQLKQRYPNISYRMLAGHGNFALHTMLMMIQQNELFDAYLCFAPPVHLWGNHEKVFRRFLIDHWHWNNDLYISMGFGDEAMMKETLEFCRLLGAHALERPIDYKFDLMPEITNQSIFEQSMANALKYFFKEIPLGILLPYDGAEGLRKYKAGLEAKFGFDPLNLKIPQQSIAVPLLLTALNKPDRLPWQYRWLKSDPEAVYSNNATDLFNLYNYLMAHSHRDAAAEIQKLLRSEFDVKRLPDWKTLKHANNYTSSISLENGLIAQFDFTKGIKDISPISMNLSTHGSLTNLQDGYSAVYFDGKSDYIEIKSTPETQFAGSFSFSGWIKPERELRFEAFVSQNHPDNNRSLWRIGFGAEAEFQWGMSMWNNAWKDYAINHEIPRNEWSHLAVVADHSLAQVHYYFNGEHIGTVEQLFPILPSEKPILIGAKGNGDYYRGHLADIRLYNRGLSPAEVKQIYLLKKILKPEEGQKTDDH
jgi:hypothetical protein